MVAWIGLSLALYTYWTKWIGVAWRVGLLVFAMAFAEPAYRMLLAPDELLCSVLSVGHGSSTLLELPDAGSSLRCGRAEFAFWC